jgi:hypothetical protein
MKNTSKGIILLLLVLIVGCIRPAIEESNNQPVITQKATATITELHMEKTLTSPIPNKSLNFNTASGVFLSSDQIPSDCNKTFTLEQSDY